MKQKPKIWLITGISSGFGKELALELINKGDYVIGTFRKEEQVQAFNKQYAGKATAYQLDVADHTQAASIVNSVIKNMGRIDVLVNNAGYGLTGAIEEVSMQELREQMETNFFGAFNMTQLVLPHMRKQRSGHILQISSMLGIFSTPGTGVYCASKFAIEGFSEALAAELKPLNIKVTLVEPGPFRTGFLLGTSLKGAKRKISDYDLTAGPVVKQLNEGHGKQKGDPKKAVLAMMMIVDLADPPLRLPLGQIAIDKILTKLGSVKEEVENWVKVPHSVVDYPAD